MEDVVSSDWVLHSLLGACFSRISLMMVNNYFEDVVWSNLLFRSASVTIGLFASWMSGSRGRSIMSQISLGIDQGGTARRAFPFASSFVMRRRSFFIGVSAIPIDLNVALCLYSFTSPSSRGPHKKLLQSELPGLIDDGTLKKFSGRFSPLI